MNHSLKTCLLCMALPFSMLLSSCGCSDTPQKPTPTSISFDNSSVTLLENEELQLNINVNPAGEYEDVVITYSSSNTNVATVSETGLLKALKDGSSTITASLEKYHLEASLKVLVYPNYEFDVQEDEYQYEEATYKDWPSFTNYTQGLAYELTESGDSYRVVRGGTVDTDIIIPEEHEGLPVTEIGNEAFANYWFITKVYIPKTIKKIGLGAFSASGIEYLYYDAEEITDFPGNNWVFYPQNKADLDNPDVQFKQNIHLLVGPNVKCIPSRFFMPLGTHTNIQPKVGSIEFSKNSKVETIGEYAFYGLENITKVHLPTSLKEIGEYSFYNSGLTELVLPNSVSKISANAFMFSSNLEHLKLSTSLTTIGNNAFSNCTSLKYLSFKDNESLKAIGECAFKNCSSLEYLDLGHVKEIGGYAFQNCSSLKTIYLSNIVTKVYESAFIDCSGCETLYLGSSIEYIGNDAFSGLINVKKLFVGFDEIDELPAGNAVFLNLGKNVTDGVDVVFTTNVTSVAKRMFFSNSDVESFIKIRCLFLPKSLLVIYEYAFYGASVSEARYYGKTSEFADVVVEPHNILPNIICLGE